MNAGEICNREVVVAYKTMTLPEAARLMREHHVGSVVVVVDRLSERVPIAMLTDRDLTVAVLAQDLDPRTLAVGDVVTKELYTVREQDSISDTLRLMRERGVRRVPVLTHSGALWQCVVREAQASDMDGRSRVSPSARRLNARGRGTFAHARAARLRAPRCHRVTRGPCPQRVSIPLAHVPGSRMSGRARRR